MGDHLPAKSVNFCKQKRNKKGRFCKETTRKCKEKRKKNRKFTVSISYTYSKRFLIAFLSKKFRHRRNEIIFQIRYIFPSY